MAVPELDELAKALPERAPDGRFYWQPFVDRIEKRFDGLPAPDGGESFVQWMCGRRLPGGAGYPAQHAVGTPGAAPVGSAGRAAFSSCASAWDCSLPPVCDTSFMGLAGCGSRLTTWNGTRAWGV